MGEFYDLISFNRFLTLASYKAYLKKKERDVCFNHEDIPSSTNNAIDFQIAIKSQFVEALTEFVDKCGFLIHKQTSIKDKNGNHIQFEDLPDEIKQKISLFISLQKLSLQNFLLKINPVRDLRPVNEYEFTGSITDFVEFTNAFSEGGFIIAKNGQFTKKEFTKDFAQFLNVKIDSPEKILHKSMMRKNPTQFIDKLKDIQSRYCDDKFT